jgi:hypothetical protein
MPGTTSTRNLRTLLTSDVITSFASTVNAVTTSVETELNRTVAFYNYSVANAAARTALTGMVDGSLCLQTDNNEYWWYDAGSTAWKLFSKPKSTFVSTLTNFGSVTTANGTYSVSNGICYVDLEATLGTGFSTTAPTFSLPIATTNFVSGKIAGNALYTNISLSQYHLGAALWASTATTVTPYYISSTNGRLLPVISTTGNPLTEAWATGDKMAISISYAV